MKRKQKFNQRYVRMGTNFLQGLMSSHIMSTLLLCKKFSYHSHNCFHLWNFTVIKKRPKYKCCFSVLFFPVVILIYFITLYFWLQQLQRNLLRNFCIWKNVRCRFALGRWKIHKKIFFFFNFYWRGKERRLSTTFKLWSSCLLERWNWAEK